MYHKDIKIISLGAAVQDVFLQGKIFKAHKDEDGDDVQEFELGTKNDVEEITFSTGGGATNAAVTFARHGFHSCYIGRIGKDIAGKAVMEVLHEDGVDTSLVMHDDKLSTGYSAILLSGKGERTILTHRGASNDYRLKESHFHNYSADWLYVSSLSGDVDALKTAIKFAKEKNINIAVNPGGGELKHKTEIREILKGIDVLSLNREEMIDLFGGSTLAEVMKEASKFAKTVLLTDGPKGAYATDGVHVFKSGLYKDVKVFDRTGAGDAFSSGFVAEVALGHSIERALTFASANSTSVVSKIGAKAGILHGGSKLESMKIQVTQL